LPKNAAVEGKKQEIKNNPVPPASTPKKRGRPPKKAAISTDVFVNPQTKKSKIATQKRKEINYQPISI